MEFKKGKRYLCIHDVLIGTRLKFKSDHTYKCIDDNVLIDTDHNNIDMSLYNTKWDMYFNESSNSDKSSTFKDITDKMNKIYQMKNHDYGNSFDKSCDEFGITAALVRMSDKFNRIKTLINKNNNVKDESIEDTLLDLANYSIMTLIWYKNNKNEFNNN